MKKKISVLGFLILLGFCMTMFSLITIHTSQQELQDIRRTSVLAEHIRYYDEVLTMSARMASNRDSSFWVDRYYQYTEPLDQAIGTAISLFPEIEAPLMQVDDANRKLIELEEESFGFSLRGDYKTAQDILFSEKYLTLKEQYALGLEDSLSVLSSSNEVEAQHISTTLFIMQCIIVASVLIILVAAYYIYKLVTRSLKTTEVLFEALPVGIVLVDEHKTIRQINRAALKMMGREEGDVLGHICHNFMCPAQVDECPLWDLKSEVDNSEKVLLLADGSKMPILKSAQYISMLDGETLLMETFVDIRERKQIEMDLEVARERAEDASKSKSAFLATMSHEIRTPMNAIQGMADLLLEGAALSHEQRGFVEIIQGACIDLIALINDILDYSKIEAGKIDLEMISFDLENTVNAIISLLTPKAEAKGLKLLVDFDMACPRFIRSDAGRLRQILLNLLSNAIKFTHEGHVLLRVRSSKEKGKDWLRFEVEDTGIGISGEVQEKIFDVFVQADSSTTRKYGGSGLGLSISRRLVELLGGEIGVEGNPSGGSSFSFTVPLTVSRAPEELHRARLNDVHILVVDDYETNRTIFKRQLESFGMKVEAASDGFSALEELNRAAAGDHPIEIVLTDQNMPEMDGVTLVKRIAQAPEAISTSIVVVTSSGHRGDSRILQQAGASGYLVKPVSREMLYDFLTSVLGTKDHKGSPFITRELLTEHMSKRETGEETVRFSAHVLVAEDTAANVVVITSILKTLGLTVVVAPDGKEAFDRYTEEPFDVVLMDLRMPVMDGFESIRQIRKFETAGKKRTPVIAVTADVLPETIREAYEVGADGFISKPFKLEDITGTLSRFLQPIAVQEEISSVLPQQIDALENGSIDTDQLKLMRENLGGEFEEFISVYLGEVREMLTSMERAWKRGDLTEVRRLAHSIKSSSLNAGARELAQSAKILEDAARAGDTEVLQKEIAVPANLFTSVSDALSTITGGKE